MEPPERALEVLRDAYSAGHLSTATLEARAEWVLGGRIDDALWDLPRAGGARRRRCAASSRARSNCRSRDRGRWMLGRGSGCDLVLAGDDAISRAHAEIAVRAGLCLIRDLDSCNGTLLNGRFVQRARCVAATC